MTSVFNVSCALLLQTVSATCVLWVHTKMLVSAVRLLVVCLHVEMPVDFKKCPRTEERRERLVNQGSYSHSHHQNLRFFWSHGPRFQALSLSSAFLIIEAEEREPGNEFGRNGGSCSS